MEKEKNNFKQYQSKETNASSYTLREEEVLVYWNEKDIFKKTLEKPTDPSKGDFVFFEGPPTANGRPGIHHLESRAFKDAIPRYKTMQGYRVARRAGWDTHGLPVELEVEKQLGLTSKKQIEEYGIEKFNAQCRVSVWKYVNEWEDFTRRIGYWVDLENPYVTYRNDYVETLWWVMKQIAGKDLLYKDYKVVPWCPRCGTGLSSHELAQGYADVKDLSITAKFELIDEPGTYILAWTTTPWTLPGNVALAVGEKIEYVKVKVGSEYLIVAKDLAAKVLKDQLYEVVDSLSGKDLIGKSYKPLFPQFKELAEKGNIKNLENAYKVYAADFVTTTDGTGIVHTAVMYGQDDFELGTKVGLPKMHLVRDDGTFISGTGFLEGRFVKEEKDGKPTIDIDVIKYLQENNTFFSKEKYEHSYPHCWRCKTPLIYYARDSWYINMQAVKDKLISENNEINWEPSHVREGRFGEWIADVKDWAISRERYWGTPLPIWQSTDGEQIVIGSFDELRKLTKKSGNKYFAMRHGEGEHNVQDIANSDPKVIYNLTEKGRDQARATAEKLKGEGITKIFYSPLPRSRQTAEIVAGILGIPHEELVEDTRLREIGYGAIEGKDFNLFRTWRDTIANNFYTDKNSEDAESYFDVKRRIGEFWYEVDKKYSGENILFVAHGALLEVGPAIGEAASLERAIEIFHEGKQHTTGVVEEIPFTQLPHNENYELDPHRPFIDDVVLEKDGKEFRRVKEVIDVWFDSGCMPFAQVHHPFNAEQKLAYPADFICEGMDQTRGWFYTLHAIGNLLGLGKAFKNVISVGLVNDEEGQKMSKSRGNTVNPWDAVNTFGVDTLRFWMYSVNAPGEAKNFDEKMIIETQRKVFGLLDNVVKFYEMYAPEGKVSNTETSENVLDQWIVARLNQLIELCTKSLDKYQLLEPARAIRDFIADLSQWYIRRSRDRFKSDDVQDKNAALATTQFVLVELSKIMAPFVPFFAEDMYGRVGGDLESVHLEHWSELRQDSKDSQVLEHMEMTRNIISQALEARASAGIKVRQVLGQLTITQGLSEKYRALIQDEVNVKEVILGETLTLDTTITPELEAEGNVREFIRTVQDMRKNKALQPSDAITLSIETDEAGKNLVEQFGREIQKTAGVEKFVFESNDGEQVAIGAMKFKIILQ